MTNFYETVLEVLKQDSRFIADDGTFMRNAVYEAAMKMDAGLIRLLLSNEETSSRFFADVDGVKVFDKVRFAWVINNRQFLPDSYTRFKNKIGLVDEMGEMISNSGKVELVFPYKDCVLEGGQTKEDQKRQEIFYNETLAPDEIDRLLYPKVLVNTKRYTKDKIVENITDFSDTDNLVIKGNNLLALASMNKRFKNKVRMAYWDIPYNTNSDSFGYNDRFSRSTWLVFMKNRVEKVLPLLTDNGGVILIHCSFHQYSYLKVLLDEVIGNYVMTFNVLVRHPDRTLTGDKEFNDVIEYVLVYSKRPDFKMPKIEEEKIVDEYQWIVNEISEGKSITLGEKKAQIFTPDQYEMKKVSPAKENFKIVTVRGSIKEKVSSGRFYMKYLQPLEKEYPAKTIFRVEGIGDDMYNYRYFYLPPKGNKNGAYLQGMPISSEKTYKPYPNFLDFVQSYNTVNKEGNVEFRNGKKPEEMLAYFMGIFTAEKDIVLDAFAGAGTCAAVAIKMKRQFITCEQMDYAENVTVKRIYGVIRGEESDLLAEYGFTSGGSFVYCELAKLNQAILEEIEVATDEDTLIAIWDKIKKSGFISYKVDPATIDEAVEEYAALSLDDKKRFLMELLDKNLLYVNTCDMDDEEYAISDTDKAFTKSFYGEA